MHYAKQPVVGLMLYLAPHWIEQAGTISV